MKFTLGWLRDFLEFDVSVEVICQRLTEIGLEVESMEGAFPQMSDFTVVEIVSVEKHKDADKLNVCQVKTQDSILNIVCGANNVRVGLKTILAPVGAIVPNGNFKIKKSKIRGVISEGMLCSAQELNLHDDENKDGILDLPEDSLIGADLGSLKLLNDVVIDIAITPNRGDCLGVYGIARDLAAAGIGRLKDLPEITIIPKIKDKVGVDIKTPYCSKFCGIVVKNIGSNFANNKEITQNIPEFNYIDKFIKSRLIAIDNYNGIPVIDILNYVTHCFATPMHAYRLESVSAGIVLKEENRTDVRFLALDDKTYKVPEGSLVAYNSDKQELLALSAIIGAKDSAIGINTADIYLEAAAFDKVKIASVARQVSIETNAKYIFERGTDPDIIEYAIKYFLKLLQNNLGADCGFLDININNTYNNITKIIDFSSERFGDFSTLKISDNKIQEYLIKLGFSVEKTINGFKITVPNFRHDISIEEDIYEELIRLEGIENINYQDLPKLLDIENNFKEAKIFNDWIIRLKKFCLILGLNEVITWSFLSKEVEEEFDFSDDNLISLKNPISAEFAIMRPSLVPNLLKYAVKNFRREINNCCVFEIGRIFKGVEEKSQSYNLTIMRAGSIYKKHTFDNRKYDVFDIKADIYAIVKFLGLDLDKVKISQDNVPSYYHPGKTAVLRLKNEVIAIFGVIHPNIVKKYKLSEVLSFGEIFVEKILSLTILQSKKKKKLTSLAPYIVSNFQPIIRDLSFILDSSVKSLDLITLINSCYDDLISEVRIFDIYKGDDIEDNKVALSVSFKITPIDKNLTAEEIVAIMKTIAQKVEKNLNGILRDGN